jgi:hypothetical protein
VLVDSSGQPLETVIYTVPQNTLTQTVALLSNNLFGSGTALTQDQINVITHLAGGQGAVSQTAQLAVAVEQVLATSRAFAQTAALLFSQLHLTAAGPLFNSSVQFLSHGGTRLDLAIRLLSSDAYVNTAAARNPGMNRWVAWVTSMYMDYYKAPITLAGNSALFNSLFRVWTSSGTSRLAVASAALRNASGYTVEIRYVYSQFLHFMPDVNDPAQMNNPDQLNADIREINADIRTWVPLFAVTNENEIWRRILSTMEAQTLLGRANRDPEYRDHHSVDVSHPFPAK